MVPMLATALCLSQLQHQAGTSDQAFVIVQVHSNIRKKPTHEKAARTKPAQPKRWQPIKLTYDQRKENLKQKLAALTE
jgi:hypothetical protein